MLGSIEYIKANYYGSSSNELLFLLAVIIIITQRQLDIKGAYIQDAYMALEDEIMVALLVSAWIEITA